MRHLDLGKASLICVVLSLAYVAAMLVWRPMPFAAVAVYAWLFPLLVLLGLVLGIAGLLQREGSKTFAAIGSLLSLAMMCGLFVLNYING